MTETVSKVKSEQHGNKNYIKNIIFVNITFMYHD